MVKVGINGAIVGALIGLWAAWANWPIGRGVDGFVLARAVSQVIGSAALGWLAGWSIARFNRR